MIRFFYNTQKRPAAPFVFLTIRHPHNGLEIQNVPAQVDTGADRTVLPLDLASALGLDQIDAIPIAGFGGKAEEMPVYEVSVAIRTFPFQLARAIAHADEPWILLGRDVLNGYRIVFDGPNLALEID